jgi:hypothetical protein
MRSLFSLPLSTISIMIFNEVKPFLDNQFKKVFEELLKDSKNELYFQNNEFICDKYMKWLHNYFK